MALLPADWPAHLVSSLHAGVILALLLAAVQKVREAAARVQSMNNIRQIILAATAYSAGNENRLPGIVDYETPFLVAILPYLEQGNAYRTWQSNLSQPLFVRMYLSPADPILPEALADRGVGPLGFSSYAANYQVFKNNPILAATIPDGTSQTIAIAEHYAADCGGFAYLLTEATPDPPNHRTTFADVGDVDPVTSGTPPTSIASFPDHTFQVAPLPQNCSGIIAQGPHPSGMLAALCDGSLRTLARGMAETTYWAAVTPAGGEVLGPDW
jgi:hypothetical protein